MDKPTFFERLSSLLLREPEDRIELIQLLRVAHEKKLLDADALSIAEGALAASERSVREVMVPRSQMDVLHIEDPFEEVVLRINETGHSRFPVIESSRDEVLGVLLAKDLLRVKNPTEFSLRDWIRPVVFIPEFKRLNVLLREFRVSRHHLAIVIDEYAVVTGLVTIEDVLEQIVGEIEDEYDLNDQVEGIQADRAGRHRMKGTTPLREVNETLGSDFSEAGCDTIGGFILRHLGRMPLRNETIIIDAIRFQILRVDSRRLYTLFASRIDPTDAS